MKTDENIEPKPVNDSAEARKKEALIRENENRLRQEGVKKAVVTTSIIGFVVLLIAITAIINYCSVRWKHRRIHLQRK